MRQVEITSEANPLVKRWMRLASTPRFARKEGAIIAEGAHLAQVIRETGTAVRRVAVRAGGVSREIEDFLPGFLQQAGIGEVVVLSSALYDRISPVEHGAGLFVEAAMPQGGEADPSADALYLDGVQDPGNVGTLIRSAVASGVRQIALSPSCAWVWSAKVLRAGMGAHFSARIFAAVEPQELATLFAGRRLAADARGGADLYATPGWEKGPTVWMLGSEGLGLSEPALAAAQQRLYIPIAQETESLNVAAAGAVCLFEQLRRRRCA